MKLTIYKKMMLGFGAIIVIMIIASTYILLKLNDVSNSAETTLTTNVKAVDLAKQLQDILHDENVDAQKYLISHDETYFSLFIASSRRFDSYLDLLLHAQSDTAWHSLIKNMRRTHETFVAEVQKVRNLQNSKDNLERNSLKVDSMETLSRSLDHLININRGSIENAMSRMKATTTRSAQIALLLIIGTVLVAVLAAFIITRTITRPIDDLIRGTQQIARGNFKQVQVSSNDEIALLVNAVNDMSNKIKDINELRTHMMQQISHELQTPLQVMLSGHDILKNQCSGLLNAEQVQMLDSIRRGIIKLSSFSRQYLDLAKIDSGMMKYHMVWADLLQIVEPLVKDAKLIAEPKNITVEMSSLPAPKVRVDSKKVSIVVSNLLSNAIKYTRNNGKVMVKVGPCPLGSQVKIQDSGIGISQEELPKIFTKFYQAGNTGRIKSRGTGVGLALVKAFTEGHGGRVYAESTVDRGSTFTIELPVEPEEFQSPAINLPIQT
ncbi:MAG: ATP-binding protein [Desulfobacteraceae bacterium]|nr:ATP-binding protein [Desulfobacteraceae bacterium]MDH3874362.1 ATP-binding protein [Desulfobacteraceae bacterium]MDH3881566.1 ATP-binding protein [Desulfobacteraceae bacterium]MDH3955568.1 ATP-binding protein [Desulfobacteraceae bacterium]